MAARHADAEGGGGDVGAEEQELSRQEFLRQVIEELALNERAVELAGRVSGTASQAAESQGDQLMASMLRNILPDASALGSAAEFGGLASASAANAAAGEETFRELGFDFPLVELDGVRALDKLVQERLAHERGLPTWFWLSEKALDGIDFCRLERKGVSDALRKALNSLAVTMLVKVVEVALEVDAAARAPLLLAPKERPRADAQVMCVARLEKALQRVSYQTLGGLSVEEWEAAHVTASLFRIVRRLLSLGTDAEGDGEWARDLRAEWPRFLFILRDRITDKSASVKTVLPTLLDMANLCNKHCRLAETDGGEGVFKGDVRGNPLLLGVLRTIATNSGLEQAPISDRAVFWDFVDRQVLPQLGPMLEQMMAQQKAVALHEDGNRFQGAGASRFSRDQLVSLLEIVEYYGRGDPRRAFGVRVATATLVKLGLVRSLAMAWIKGSQAFPLDLPSLSSGGVSPSSDGSRTALRVDRVGDLLFLCALRDPSLVHFLVRLPRFYDRLSSDLVADHQRLGWAVVISHSNQSTDSGKNLEDSSGTLLGPGRCTAWVQMRLEDLARETAELGTKAEADRIPHLQVLAGVVEALDRPLLIQVLQAWELKPVLVRTLRAVLRDVSAVALSSPTTHPSPQPQDAASAPKPEAPKPDSPDAELASTSAERQVRVRLLVKRLLCKLEDVGSKAD